jgi:hypothetical protein
MLGAPGSSLSHDTDLDIIRFTQYEISIRLLPVELHFIYRLGTFSVFVSPTKQMAVVLGLPEIRTRRFPSMFCITNHPTAGLYIVTGIDRVK